MSLEPSQVFMEFLSQPPLMRGETAKAFCGQQIEWSLIYRNAYQASSGQVHILFATPTSATRLVEGTVLLADYPQLQQLQADETILVRGSISHVDILRITLNIRELVLPKTVGMPS